MSALLNYTLTQVEKLNKEPLREAFLELQTYTKEREKLLQAYVTELNILKANPKTEGHSISANLDSVCSDIRGRDEVLMELSRQLSVRTDQCMHFQREFLELKCSLVQRGPGGPDVKNGSTPPTSYKQALLLNQRQPTTSVPVSAPLKAQKPKHVPKLVNPEHSLIINKFDNPSRYVNTLHLKSALSNADDSILALISSAKVTNGGKLLVEATEPDARERLITKLEPISSNIFGPNAEIRTMNNVPQRKIGTVLLRNIPSDYDVESVRAEIVDEYPSLRSISSLLKPGSDARYQSFKLEIANDNELSRIKEDGVHIGLCLYRVQTWISPPTQCYRCQRYNHLSSTCRSSHRCIVCGEDHAPDKNCLNPTKCANCGEAHKANYSGCLVRKALMSGQHSDSEQ